MKIRSTAIRSVLFGLVPAACLAPLVLAGDGVSAPHVLAGDGVSAPHVLVGDGVSAPHVLVGDGVSAPHQGLARVNPPADKPAQDAQAQDPARRAPFDAVAWKTRVSDRDLDARERAFDELATLVRRDPDARRAVEDWSRDARDPELSWTSRLLLREARDAREPFGRGAGWNDLRAQMDELERGFGGLGSMLDDMQQRMDRNFGGFGAQPNPGAAPGGVDRRSQSYSMQMGPDGVKIEVDEDIDGKKETKTYTAKSLDELYAAHPELKDKIGLRMRSGPGVHVFGPDGSGFEDFDRLFSGRAGPFGRSGGFGPGAFGGFGGNAMGDGALDGNAVPTDRLGVYVDDAAIDRAQLKIDDGVGLRVRGVQPGTMAARMGIETGDVVIDVNGRTVHGVDDVRGALEARKIDQDVSVIVVDGHGQRRTLTWRASPTQQDERSF